MGKKRKKGLGVDLVMARVARSVQESKYRYFDTDVQHWYFQSLKHDIGGLFVDEVRILPNLDVRLREKGIKVTIPFVVLVDRDRARVEKRVRRLVKPIMAARREGREGPAPTPAPTRSRPKKKVKRERPR